MTSPDDVTRLPPLLLLHPDDNIVVARRDIAAGESLELDGEVFVNPAPVELGHKLARRSLDSGMQVFKYGAPIGSLRSPVARGEHVHLHNLKSDYVSATHRDDPDGH
jgi:hypothetical protein